MPLILNRLATDDGGVFENVEIAPDALQVLHVGDARVLEFFVTRKVERSRAIPHPRPGGPTEVTEVYWPIIPGSKFQIPFDPEAPLHQQAYAAITADPRFGGGV